MVQTFFAFTRNLFVFVTTLCYYSDDVDSVVTWRLYCSVLRAVCCFCICVDRNVKPVTVTITITNCNCNCNCNCFCCCTALSSYDQQYATPSPPGGGHVTQHKPMTSSISPSSTNSSIPNPQAYMINPVQQLRSQHFNPTASGIYLDDRQNALPASHAVV